tara:strand:- start:119 stop:244 length:126 start_codon:yes stop_codon:yes gene_type:complete
MDPKKPNNNATDKTFFIHPSSFSPSWQWKFFLSVHRENFLK